MKSNPMTAAGAGPGSDDRSSNSPPVQGASAGPEKGSALRNEVTRLSALLPGMRRSIRLRGVLLFLCVWIAAGAYLGANLMRGWVPHDDGALAQSAERVLHGQLPHRDFVEIYTGGLSFLHAFALRAFGVHLGSLRIALFLFFLAWLPAVYFLVREMAPDWVAGGITLLAAAWSAPNYAAALPSWYNLFFATFGAAALFRYLKRPTPFWLFVAGVCGGASFLAKSTGLCFVAAVLLFLLYREQSLSCGPDRRAAGSARAYSAFVAASLLTFLGLLTALLRAHFGLSEFLHFILPGAALAVLLLFREWQGVSASATQRSGILFRLTTPFLAGVLFPVVLFLVPYFRAHAVSEFFAGVFLLPSRRVLGASMRPTGIEALLPTLVFAGLLARGFRVQGRERAVLSGVIFPACLLLLFASFRLEAAYRFSWHAVQGSIPLLTVLGAGALCHFHRATRPPPAEVQQRLMILLSLAALCSLVQFPFAAPIYFCYVAPLAIVAAVALFSSFPHPPKLLLATVSGFALTYAGLLMTPGFILYLGGRYSPNRQTAPLVLPRAGGLRVTPEMAQVYNQLIPAIREHAAGSPILAGPDCPEVYFLGGFDNPTGSIFEMFEEHAGYKERIEKLIEEKSVKAVVINWNPGFSASFFRPFRSAALEHFPSAQRIGPFELRWRP